MTLKLALSLSFLATASLSLAQVVSGSDGSDGALTTVAGLQSIDLNQAVNGTWNQPSTAPGAGVYDAAQWAVVYKYSSVTLNTGSGLWFQRHRTNAPVVWLVQGNVNIQTNSFLHLQSGIPTSFNSETSESSLFLAGPGGWDGGYPGQLTTPAGSGFGPLADNATASAYSNDRIIPLVGGSGGPGSNSGARGVGGAGAILIVAGGTITVNGLINAYSNNNGSGGAIKLICTTLGAGNGTIRTGNGRVRIEAQTNNYFGNVNGNIVSIFGTPNNPQIWPDSLTPSAEIIQIASLTPPTDPNGKIETPDVNIGSPATYPVVVRCKNVPTTPGLWTVRVRYVKKNGNSALYPATFTSGNQAISLWTVNIPITEGAGGVQAHAFKN